MKETIIHSTKYGSLELRDIKTKRQVHHSAIILQEMVSWIEGGQKPDTLRDTHFAANRLNSLRTWNSAAYKELHTLVLRQSGDFCSGTKINLAIYFNDKLDIHHIFPRFWRDQESRQIPTHKRDCIIKKMAISARANRSIGSRMPSEYLPTLRNIGRYDEARQREILASHHITFDGIAGDDFEGFIAAREEALLSLIEKVTAKQVTRTPGIVEPLAAEAETEVDNDG